MSDMRGLQAGIRAIACNETRTTEHKIAAPRAGANELRGSVDCVGPAVETGEDELIRETCWTRLVTAERVTVTEREKLNGVTDVYKTCKDDEGNRINRATKGDAGIKRNNRDTGDRG